MAIQIVSGCVDAQGPSDAQLLPSCCPDPLVYQDMLNEGAVQCSMRDMAMLGQFTAPAPVALIAQ